MVFLPSNVTRLNGRIASLRTNISAHSHALWASAEARDAFENKRSGKQFPKPTRAGNKLTFAVARHPTICYSPYCFIYAGAKGIGGLAAGNCLLGPGAGGLVLS